MDNMVEGRRWFTESSTFINFLMSFPMIPSLDLHIVFIFVNPLLVWWYTVKNEQ